MAGKIIKTLDLLLTYFIAILITIAVFTVFRIISAPPAEVKADSMKTPQHIINLAYREEAPEEFHEAGAPNYPKNKYGQTYGGIDDIPNDPYAVNIIYPDLFLAKGTGGTIGYVYTSELNAGDPKNPEEASEYMRKIEEFKKNGLDGRIISLFDVDGVTVIGEFKIQY